MELKRICEILSLNSREYGECSLRTDDSVILSINQSINQSVSQLIYRDNASHDNYNRIILDRLPEKLNAH